MFWGVSTTLFFCAIAVIGSDFWFLMILFPNLGTSMQGVWVLYVIFIFILPIVSAVIIASNSTFTIPCLCRLLVKVCCFQCNAHTLVTLFVLYFDMLALQMLCHHGVVAFLAIPAAPVTIVTNVLLIVLLGTCVIHTIAFFFTVFGKLVTIHQTWKKLRTQSKKEADETQADEKKRNPADRTKYDS